MASRHQTHALPAPGGESRLRRDGIIVVGVFAFSFGLALSALVTGLFLA